MPAFAFGTDRDRAGRETWLTSCGAMGWAARKRPSHGCRGPQGRSPQGATAPVRLARDGRNLGSGGGQGVGSAGEETPVGGGNAHGETRQALGCLSGQSRKGGASARSTTHGEGDTACARRARVWRDAHVVVSLSAGASRGECTGRGDRRHRWRCPATGVVGGGASGRWWSVCGATILQRTPLRTDDRERLPYTWIAAVRPTCRGRRDAVTAGADWQGWRACSCSIQSPDPVAPPRRFRWGLEPVESPIPASGRRRNHAPVGAASATDRRYIPCSIRALANTGLTRRRRIGAYTPPAC